MSLLGIGKSKKRHQQELLERDRLQQQREQHFREELHLQQQENARRESMLQERVLRIEREEYQRREAERQQHERLMREQENIRIQREQAKMARQERENLRLARLRQTTPEALRALRDLIRERYQLDIKIWGLRGVKEADHEDVIELGRKADAVLEEIHDIVDTWEKESSDWTEEEWRVAERIKVYLNLDVKRKWEGNPPWNEPY